MTARQEWLLQYIKHVMEQIKVYEGLYEWSAYIKNVAEFADELKWAATEWERCYKNE